MGTGLQSSNFHRKSGHRQTLVERVQLSLHTNQKYLEQVLPVLSPETPWDSPTVSTFGLRNKDSKELLLEKLGAGDPSGISYQMRQKKSLGLKMEQTEDTARDHNTVALGFLILAEAYNFRTTERAQDLGPMSSDQSLWRPSGFFFGGGLLGLFFILSQPITWVCKGSPFLPP